MCHDNHRRRIGSGSCCSWWRYKFLRWITASISCLIESDSIVESLNEVHALLVFFFLDLRKRIQIHTQELLRVGPVLVVCANYMINVRIVLWSLIYVFCNNEFLQFFPTKRRIYLRVVGDCCSSYWRLNLIIVVLKWIYSVAFLVKPFDDVLDFLHLFGKGIRSLS